MSATQVPMTGTPVVSSRRTAWLGPAAVLLGTGWGSSQFTPMLLVLAGLAEVQQLADGRALAGVTAAYYALTYFGFAAPFLLGLAAHVASYPLLLSITAALALATAPMVARGAARSTRQLVS
jgi:dipeptide/tripeptide permease